MGECSVSSSSSLSWYAAMGIKLQCEVHPQEFAALNKDAKIDHSADEYFMAKEEMEPVRGDYDLNLGQTSDDPLKESLRSRLLNQEEVFRKQVVELHRLYWVQKNLMKDFGQKELDGSNFVKPSTQPVLGAFTKHIKNQWVPVEKAYYTFSQLSSAQPMNQFLEEHVNNSSRHQQRFLNLEFPANQCIQETKKDVLNKGHGKDTSERLAEMKHNSHCATEYSWDDLRLSLSIGTDKWQNGHGKRICCKKNVHFSSPYIIDLEESADTVLRGDVRATSALCSTTLPACFGDKRESQESIQSSCSFADSMNKHKANGITNYLKSNCSGQGLEQRHGGLSCLDAKDNMFKCHDREDLDLNRDLVNESSSRSSDVCMDSPPRGNSAGQRLFGDLQEDMSPSDLCWKKLDGNCSNQKSILLQQDTVTSTLIGSDCTSNCKTSGESILCPIDLESASGIPEHHGDHDSQNQDLQHINVVPVNENEGDIAMPEISTKKAKEDTVLADLHKREDTGSNGSLASCKSNHIPESYSSSTQTTQPGTDLEKSNVFSQHKFRNSESSGIVKSSPQEESESFALCEVKSETRRERKGEFAELDVMVQKGAVSLVYFVLDSSSRDQDGLVKAEESNKVENVKNDQPQCSSESFESIVLKLPDSSADDYCVSSKPFEVDNTSKNDCGVKLRRGRRLKDFQKDILPQLSSLSSNEVFEDMKIMEGVLRSREYKRLRSKMSNAQLWSAPVRSRRSKPNYVSRRYYS